MLSRVAHSVYWLNRYVERAENVARFIDVNYNLTLGEPDSLGNQWAPLIYTTGDQDVFHERYGSASRENVLQFLSFDEQYPNSTIFSVTFCTDDSRDSACGRLGTAEQVLLHGSISGTVQTGD
jgi:uncharacterized alpha-E superfamily protein